MWLRHMVCRHTVNRRFIWSVAALVVIFGWHARLLKSTACTISAVNFVKVAEQASQPAPLGIPLGAPRAQVESLFEAAKIPRVSSDAEADVYGEPPAKIADAGQVYLSFYQGQLARALCLIDVESQEADPYVRRYEELKQALTEKYGRPVKSREYVDPDYRDHLLLAIKTGKAVYASFWKTGDMDVSLMLMGDNYKTEFVLSYGYRQLSEKLDRERKQAEKNKL
jgi:hypothetical protein